MISGMLAVSSSDKATPWIIGKTTVQFPEIIRFI
jgi:hypothetical protein